MRAAMAYIFDAVGAASGADFARFLRGDGATAPPCWGAIAQQFDATFVEDGPRIDVLEALFDLGERRALLLFMEINRGRPTVLAALLRFAPRLAPAEQRALVAIVLHDGIVKIDEAARGALHPGARELLGAPGRALASERELFEARVGALRAMHMRAARSEFADQTHT